MVQKSPPGRHWVSSFTPVKSGGPHGERCTQPHPSGRSAPPPHIHPGFSPSPTPPPLAPRPLREDRICASPLHQPSSLSLLLRIWAPTPLLLRATPHGAHRTGPPDSSPSPGCQPQGRGWGPSFSLGKTLFFRVKLHITRQKLNLFGRVNFYELQMQTQSTCISLASC